MNEIISNVTVGVVIAFCALVTALIYWPGNGAARKDKQHKRPASSTKTDASR